MRVRTRLKANFTPCHNERAFISMTYFVNNKTYVQTLAVLFCIFLALFAVTD